MIYEYKYGAPMAVPAQVAGEVCEKLESENRLTPHDLVEESRPDDAPLHKAFEWDDGVAAEKYREVQAGRIIRCIVKVPEKSSSNEPVRAFVSLTKSAQKAKVGVTRYAYRHIDHVLSDPDERALLLSEAKRELEMFQRKYAQLKELDGVFGAIEAFVGKLVEEESAA